MKKQTINQRRLTMMAVGFGMAACANDISPMDMNMNMNMNMNVPGNTEITITEKAGQLVSTTVDASSNDAWIYLDMESKMQVSPMVPQDSLEWDLGFQRFKVKTNSGISGKGNMEVAKLSGIDFDSLETAPVAGYTIDATDSDDMDKDPDYAFLGPSSWYNYDGATHQLTPNDYVYVIKTVEGNYYKLKFTNYYDMAGTSGYPSFDWAPIQKPSGMTTSDLEFVVDATEQNTWIYVDLLDGATVDVTTPKMSTQWDIAISRTKIQSNSGTSGNGLSGAFALATGKTWSEVENSPTVGFVTDEMLPLPGPPGSGEYSGNAELNTWYNYDPMTHVVSVKEQIFLVRTAEGEYVKFQITNYADGKYNLKSKRVTRSPQVHTTTIEANDSASYLFLSFESGNLVNTPMNPTMSDSWDLAVSRTKMQTNSGSSGSGKGGALAPDAASLDAIDSVPAGDGCYLAAQNHTCDCEVSKTECMQMSGAWTPQCNCPTQFVEDEILPVPGPPGSGTYSGNSVLAAWYDYNHMTHQTSPKDTAYVVRTARGDYAKIKVTNYSNGSLTLDWAYAGPGNSSF